MTSIMDNIAGKARKTLATQVGPISILVPDVTNIPAEVKQLRTAVWTAEPELDQDGKQKCKPNGRPRIKKAPRNTGGRLISKTHPEQWEDFECCATCFNSGKFSGLGVLLQPGSRIVGIDLDDFAELQAKASVSALVERAQQAGLYCEYSPSGTGLRLFVKGELPAQGRRRGGIEIYSNKSFLTVTGLSCWPGEVIEAQWFIDEILALIGESNPSSASGTRALEGPIQAPADPAIVTELCETIKKQQPRLWEGKWQKPSSPSNLIKDYPSQSEADYALCGYIGREAVRCGVRRSQLAATILGVFSESGLYREEKAKTITNTTIPKIVQSLPQAPDETAHSDYNEQHPQAEEKPADVGWKELRPLRSPLPPPPTLDLTLLPASVQLFVVDAAKRMQIPAEVILTPLLISLGSVLGKKLAIQPHATDSGWFEYPNLWGAAVLEPGMLKSPALNEATKFIRELDESARQKYGSELARWKTDQALRKINEKDKQTEVKQLFKAGEIDAARTLVDALQKEQDPPVRQRQIITDATPEARLKMLGENPNGLMLIRDELSGHLAQLQRDGYENARAQELQFFDAKFDYEDDRLKREGMFAHAPRMAMYGNLQPSKMEALLFERNQANRGFDDGYVERVLQLAVMPTFSTEYKICKEQPDRSVECGVRSLFHAAHTLPGSLDANGGEVTPRKVIFEAAAEQLFDYVLQSLETSLRSPERSNAQLKSHRGKFRGTIVKLALLLAFCEDTALTEVPQLALDRAGGLTRFYLDHARRIYALGEPSDLASAHEVWAHLMSGHLADGFTPREVQMRKWKRLTTTGEVEGAIRILCEHGYLREAEDRDTGGRPSRAFFMNPQLRCKKQGKAA